MSLDREHFQGWLEAQNPDRIVGQAGTSTGCVLARYLNEWRGGHWSVGCCAIDLDPGRHPGRERLPAWAWTFIEGIDRLRPMPDEDAGVSAREALGVLHGMNDEAMDVYEVVDLTTLDSRRESQRRHPSQPRTPERLGKALPL